MADVLENPVAHDAACYNISISGSGINKYSAKQHAQAVVHHLKAVNGLIYLPGQHTMYLEDSDMAYPFRQRRYFYYLSGVNEADCYLTYDIKYDHLSLYIPPIIPQQVLWFGRGSTVKEAEDKYDVDNVRLTTSLDDDIYHWINSNCQSKVYVLHLNQKPRLSPLLSGRPEFDNTSLLPALDSSRVIKSPVEISLIRHAVNLSSTAHYKILHSITSLKSEAEIHALFLDTCIAHGAKHQGYPPIVASGTNASTLHYSKNDEALKGRGLVCLDAGCEWECYSSDVTRTFPIGEDGWASKETVDIYGIVEEMQERCIEKLRPGIAYIDLHILAHSIAIEGLLRIGIFKKDVDVNTVIERGFSKAFFPHGLGHHMGLEVHDVSSKPIMGQYQMERKPIWFDTEGNCTKIDSRKLTRFSFGTDGKAHHSPCSHFSPLLEENMVLTVEPGIYFDSYTLDKMYLPIPEFVELIDESVLDRYMHVGGVRIEDDILITANGYENLTSAPKGKEMLRIIRDGAKCQHGVDCLDSRA